MPGTLLRMHTRATPRPDLRADQESLGTIRRAPTQRFQYQRPYGSLALSVLICTQTGLLANPACPETELELFHEGVQPSSFCNVHMGDAPVTEPLDLHETDSEAPPEERLRL